MLLNFILITICQSYVQCKEEDRKWNVFLLKTLEICLKSNGREQIYLTRQLEMLEMCSHQIIEEDFKCTQRKVIDLDESYMHAPYRIMGTPCGFIGVQGTSFQHTYIWFIDVHKSMTVNMTFIHFRLPHGSSQCHNDRVDILKDVAPVFPIDTFCGWLLPFVYQPHLSQVMISLFATDNQADLVNSLALQIFYHVITKDREKIYKQYWRNPIVKAGHHYLGNSNLCERTKSDYHHVLFLLADINQHVVGNVTYNKQNIRSIIIYDGPSYENTAQGIYESNITFKSSGYAMVIKIIASSFTIDAVLEFSYTQVSLTVERKIIVNGSSHIDITKLLIQELCIENNGVTLCKVHLDTGFENRYVKISPKSLLLDTPNLPTCHYGGIMFIDGLTKQTILKWCNHLNPSMPPIRTTGSNAFIFIAIYNTLTQYFNIEIEVEADTCQGINLCQGMLPFNTYTSTTVNQVMTTMFLVTRKPGHCVAYQLIGIDDVNQECDVVYTGSETQKHVESFEVYTVSHVKEGVAWDINVEGVFTTACSGFIGEASISDSGCNQLDTKSAENWIKDMFIGISLIVKKRAGFYSHTDMIIVVSKSCEQVNTECSSLPEYKVLCTGEYQSFFVFPSPECGEILLRNDKSTVVIDPFQICIPLHDNTWFPCKHYTSPSRICHQGECDVLVTFKFKVICVSVCCNNAM